MTAVLEGRVYNTNTRPLIYIICVYTDPCIILYTRYCTVCVYGTHKRLMYSHTHVLFVYTSNVLAFNCSRLTDLNVVDKERQRSYAEGCKFSASDACSGGRSLF